MALNSWAFLLLAVCAVILVPVARGRMRDATFLTLNLAFAWSYWGAVAMPVALAFCALGWVCARLAARRGRWPLAASLVLLTVLFAVLRGYTFGAAAGRTNGSIVSSIVAFAGLSFLFFKMIHVVVDAASDAMPSLPFVEYLNYCLNFTTLLMGPIQRFQDFAAQWNGEKRALTPDFEAHLDTTNRILRGLVKAFVLAPYLQPYVLQPGVPVDTIGTGELLVRVYAFYIFLYLDFSGYCDIVIGIGSLMGIRPPENFDFPFLARNVSAYWLRVHRSLTEWLTDYVFTPVYRMALRSGWLGARGFLALAFSLFLTMLVAGVWHGTTLNFAIFGIVHGAALIVARGYETLMVGWLGRARFKRFTERPYVTAAAVLLTYNFTSLAYTFFVLDVDRSFRVIGRIAAFAAGAIA
jgi:membrane protein involved in D-alanine export